MAAKRNSKASPENSATGTAGSNSTWIGAVAIGAGAALIGWLLKKNLRISYSVDRSNSGAGVAGSDAIAAAQAPANPGGPGGIDGDVPSDLLDNRHPGPDQRAPDAFRPDPTAPVPDDRRDAFAPATMPTPNSVPAGM